MRPLIEVRGLRKDYRRGGDVLHAVDGVDLAVMPGESVGVIGEPLKIHGEHDVQPRVDEVLREVGLAKELTTRRPRDLSGGERQRVAIARAMVLRPSVLVLDEPTASVDMSSRRALLALLKRLQSEHGLSYLYISHDIRTVEETCSRTIVMYRGRLAEEGPTTAVLNSPGHVYTQILVSAIPRIGASPRRGGRLRMRPLPGQQSPPGSGCIFVDRCPRARPECTADPPMVEVTPGHRAACVLAGRTGGSQ